MHEHTLKGRVEMTTKDYVPDAFEIHSPDLSQQTALNTSDTVI